MNTQRPLEGALRVTKWVIVLGIAIARTRLPEFLRAAARRHVARGRIRRRYPLTRYGLPCP